MTQLNARVTRFTINLALLSAGLFHSGCASPHKPPSDVSVNSASDQKSSGQDETQESPSQAITATAPPAPAPSEAIVLGYFTNWAHTRKAPCEFSTSDVDASLFTHINYAFASIDPGKDKKTFTVIPSSEEDVPRLYAEVNALKKQNQSLKTFLSIGGWAFNDKPTEWIFSAMASTPETRGGFIRQAIEFTRTHGFDGIDIDWEFPGNPERGGKAEDTENFTALLREFRAQIHEEAKATGKHELLLTIASPPGPYYYQHQELGKFHSYLNWINVMTYDYHGTWEMKTGANTPLTGSPLSIEETIKAYLHMGVPREKIVLGVATYSRGWSGVKKAAAGAPAQSAGPKGPCGMESPTAAQVEALIADGQYVQMWDEESQTPFAYSQETGSYLTYDNQKSIALKMDYLHEQKLAGAMFWAIDLDDFKDGYPIISQVSTAVRGKTKKAKSPATTTAAPAP